MDEACANVRVDLDSRPQALDQVQRKVLQLEVRKKRNGCRVVGVG